MSVPIIFLGGNSKKNQTWIQEVKASFLSNYPLSVILDYESWKEDTPQDVNFEIEAQKLSKIVQNYEKYIIFAKSAGIFITLKTIKEYKIKPDFCMFLGFPKYWLDEKGENYNDLISNFDIPAVLIQNTSDPACSFKDINELLKNLNNKINVIETPGDSHSYLDLNYYQKILNNQISIGLDSV